MTDRTGDEADKKKAGERHENDGDPILKRPLQIDFFRHGFPLDQNVLRPQS